MKNYHFIPISKILHFLFLAKMDFSLHHLKKNNNTTGKHSFKMPFAETHSSYVFLSLSNKCTLNKILRSDHDKTKQVQTAQLENTLLIISDLVGSSRAIISNILKQTKEADTHLKMSVNEWLVITKTQPKFQQQKTQQNIYSNNRIISF
jgi:hypothetical protein